MCECDEECRFAYIERGCTLDHGKQPEWLCCGLEEDEKWFEIAKQDALADAENEGRLEEVRKQIEAWERGCDCDKLCPLFQIRI